MIALSPLQSLLLPYQKQWLTDRSRRRIWLKARQIGATWAGIALDALIEGLSFEHDIYVLSYRLDSSKEILQDVLWWAVRLEALGLPVVQDATATKITLTSGSRIIAMPAKPEAIRGRRGSVYVDEVSSIPRSHALWQAVYPVLSSDSRYRVSLISTPLMESGLFYEVWSEGEGWSRHEVDIYTAVRDGLDRDVDDLLTQAHNADMEYLCRFGSGGQYLSIEKLLSLQLEDNPDTPLPPHGLYLGVDLGKVADYTAICTLRVFDDSTRPPEVISTRLVKSLDYHAQRQLITSLITDMQPRRVVLDATAHAPLVDEVKAALPQDMRSRVTGHHATHGWKKSAVEGLRDRIEAKESGQSLRFSFDKTMQWDASRGDWSAHGSRVLLDDMARVEQITTPSGRISYTVKRRAGQGHGDAFSALLLALEAASRPVGGHPFKVKRKDSPRRSRRPSLTF